MKIIISNSSNLPIYEQIARQIKNQIMSGELREGEPLPSIRKLAHELQISVITTKRAYDDLEREGFLDTVGGKGTFVSVQNKDLMREKKMKIVEDKLNEAVSQAKMLGIDLEALKVMLSLLFREDE
jgi:GntR family transcriptional regulator